MCFQVWWPLDEDWYQGTVSAFDELRIQHTVCYDDGDIELLHLWGVDQTVSLSPAPLESANNKAISSTRCDFEPAWPCLCMCAVNMTFEFQKLGWHMRKRVGLN